MLGAHTLSHLTIIGCRSDFATACNRFLLPYHCIFVKLSELNDKKSFSRVNKHLRRISMRSFCQRLWASLLFSDGQ